MRSNISIPHVMVIPVPAQGHVIPLLEFAQWLANHGGCRVTFVNTEYDHNRILKSLFQETNNNNILEENLRLVSIPDGMEPWEDRNDVGKLIERIMQVMPRKLEELIIEEVEAEHGKIDCFVADAYMGWIMETVEKMNLRAAVVWPSCAASVALSFSIPKLMDDGVIDSNGTPIKKQMIELAPNMPAMNSEELFWARLGDLATQKIFFEYLVKSIKSITRVVNFQFCNSTYELEPAAFTMAPQILPIGPLLASNRLGNSAGHYWPEDSLCLKWLDQQEPNSVIYVAFGSSTVIDKIQFKELALGLELSNRPYLWVLRENFIKDIDDAIAREGSTDTHGKIINWAPQQKVLKHPAIACFLSHCGWNSTIEGVSNGVPFMCWPYHAEQFLNQSYICDVWKVGLKAERNERGIFTRDEIKNKVGQILEDQSFKARALELKEKVISSVSEGGASYKAFQDFLEWIKT